MTTSKAQTASKANASTAKPTDIDVKALIAEQLKEGLANAKAEAKAELIAEAKERKAKKEAEEKKKQEELEAKIKEGLQLAHVDFTIDAFRTTMAYNEVTEKDIVAINGKTLEEPTYSNIKDIVKREDIARRITLYLVNEYVIRGTTRQDILQGIAK